MTKKSESNKEASSGDIVPNDSEKDRCPMCREPCHLPDPRYAYITRKKVPLVLAF
jgi:hypothetical protein